MITGLNKQNRWMLVFTVLLILGIAGVFMIFKTNRKAPGAEAGKINPPTQIEAAKFKEMPQGEQKETNKASMGNIAKLKQISLAYFGYANDNKGKFSSTLDALKKGGYLVDAEMCVWTSPEDGSKDKFIYLPPASGSNKNSILAAAPRPANGMREAVFLEGYCSIITEEEFQRAIKEQSQAVKNPLGKKME